MKKGWEMKPLGSLCEFRGGGTPSKGVAKYWSGEIPWVSPKDMKCEIVTDSIDHVTEEALAKSSASLIPAGAILVVVRSGILNRTIPLSISGRPLSINQDIKAICPTPEVDPRFLLHFLRSREKVILGMVGRGATVHRLLADQLRQVPVPVPPLPEQRRIVAILDEAFEGIAAAKANAERNLRNARTVFECYRDATFTSLEQEASLKPLGEMVDDIATGPFGSLLHKSDYEEGGIPLVNPINIENDAIVPDERKAVSATTAKRLTRYRLKAGDIAVGRRGDIGRCAVVSPEQDGWLCGTGCFVIRAGKGVSPDFLAHLLRSRPYRMQLVAKAGRATMPSISNKDLADLQIPVLPPERQKNALEGFGELSAHSSQAEEVAVRKLTALDELKASFLHQAFTGAL